MHPSPHHVLYVACYSGNLPKSLHVHRRNVASRPVACAVVTANDEMEDTSQLSTSRLAVQSK